MTAKCPMPIRIPLPSLQMAGDTAPHTAHFELGCHGLALFLAPDSALPILDIIATTEQLETLVRDLHAALAIAARENVR